MGRPGSDIPERLVGAARQLFLTQGVDGASLRSIAQAADTSIGMIYYHFRTKDELFMAVVDDVYDDLLADLESALDPALPVHERIERLFARFGRMDDREAATISLVVREALVSNDRLRQVAERFKRGHVPLLVKMVSDGASSGELTGDHAPFATLLSVVSLSIFAQVIGRRVPFAALPLERLSSEELAASLCRILLNGLAGSERG